VLSYKLLWFEDDRPSQWSPAALGAVTTHDLPTIAGVWTGADLQAQRDLGLEPNEEGSAAMRTRLQDWTGAEPTTPVEQVIASAYHLLGEAPCQVLTVALDDVAGVSERPNMPGTDPAGRPGNPAGGPGDSAARNESVEPVRRRRPRRDPPRRRRRGPLRPEPKRVRDGSPRHAAGRADAGQAAERPARG
jgi:hypothetical protein